MQRNSQRFAKKFAKICKDLQRNSQRLKILEIVFNEKIGNTIHDKKEFLQRHKIALWDVLKSCEIEGSTDASIKNIKVNDIKSILDKTNIKRIYTTGKKSYELYNKYCLKETGIEAICLYSTSPANCKIKLDELVLNYQVIKDCI